MKPLTNQDLAKFYKETFFELTNPPKLTAKQALLHLELPVLQFHINTPSFGYDFMELIVDELGDGPCFYWDSRKGDAMQIITKLFGECPEFTTVKKACKWFIDTYEQAALSELQFHLETIQTIKGTKQ